MDIDKLRRELDAWSTDDVRDALYKLLYPDVGDDGQTRLLAGRLIEFFNARLRAPAGEVGEVVRRLNEHYWADKIENLVCLEAADILLRLAQEKDEEEALRAGAIDRMKAAENRATSAEALLREAGEVMQWIEANCDNGHGVRYAARAFLAKLEKPDAGD